MAYSNLLFIFWSSFGISAILFIMLKKKRPHAITKTIDTRPLAGNFYQHRHAQPMARDLRAPSVNETGRDRWRCARLRSLRAAIARTTSKFRMAMTIRNQSLFSYTMETAISHELLLSKYFMKCYHYYFSCLFNVVQFVHFKLGTI